MGAAGLSRRHFARRFSAVVQLLDPPSSRATAASEGGSASLAELLVTVSDLAHLPLRQDLTITGSVNQRGQAQAVGGVRYKVGGVLPHLCGGRRAHWRARGGRAGGVRDDLVLSDEVAEAVASGTFHIWSVVTARRGDRTLHRRAGRRTRCGGPVPGGLRLWPRDGPALSVRSHLDRARPRLGVVVARRHAI